MRALRLWRRMLRLHRESTEKRAREAPRNPEIKRLEITCDGEKIAALGPHEMYTAIVRPRSPRKIGLRVVSPGRMRI